MKFIIEKVANMIFISTDCGVIFRAWDEREFTERKLNNAIKKLTNEQCGNAEFIRRF